MATPSWPRSAHRVNERMMPSYIIAAACGCRCRHLFAFCFRRLNLATLKENTKTGSAKQCRQRRGPCPANAKPTVREASLAYTTLFSQTVRTLNRKPHGSKTIGELLVRLVPHLPIVTRRGQQNKDMDRKRWGASSRRITRSVRATLTSRVAAPKACGQEKVGSSSSPVIKDPPVVAMDSTVVASSSSAPP
jgi:hypothetical protein